MTDVAKSLPVKIWRVFNAVDLVTLAALAALFRAMDYVAGVVAFVFPFNTTLMTITFGITAITAAVIIRKPGVFTLFTLAAQLINVFVQGEMPVAGLIMLSWGVLADLYLYLRLKNGIDPFKIPARNDNLCSVDGHCLGGDSIWHPVPHPLPRPTFDLHLHCLDGGWLDRRNGGRYSGILPGEPDQRSAGLGCPTNKCVF